MKFIFVRHGKTHFNEINLTQGWCDSPLSKLGVKQVENMSLQLKDYSINKAYTSPLGRAVETQVIVPTIPMTITATTISKTFFITTPNY